MVGTRCRVGKTRYRGSGDEMSWWWGRDVVVVGTRCRGGGVEMSWWWSRDVVVVGTRRISEKKVRFFTRNLTQYGSVRK